MSRARTIKPRFQRSDSMRAVSAMARLTFIELWLVADDAGRLVAYPPSTLASRLFPGDAAAVGLLPGWLAELEREHCLERYTVDGTDYLRIVNWRRHQKIYHPTPSRLPARLVGARSVGAGQDSGALREAREALGRKSAKPRPVDLLSRFHERFARRRIFLTCHRREKPQMMRTSPRCPQHRV